MKLRRLQWSVGVVGILLVGCRGRVKPDTAEGFAPRTVSLRGTYGVANGSIVEPVLKVDETRTGYAFEERSVGEWGPDAQTPHVVREDEVQKWLGSVIPGTPVFGLTTDRATLLKLPAHWEGPDGFVTNSGYVLVSAGKLVEARKVELGGR